MKEIEVIMLGKLTVWFDCLEMLNKDRIRCHWNLVSKCVFCSWPKKKKHAYSDHKHRSYVDDWTRWLQKSQELKCSCRNNARLLWQQKMFNCLSESGTFNPQWLPSCDSSWAQDLILFFSFFSAFRRRSDGTGRARQSQGCYSGSSRNHWFVNGTKEEVDNCGGAGRKSLNHLHGRTDIWSWCESRSHCHEDCQEHSWHRKNSRLHNSSTQHRYLWSLRWGKTFLWYLGMDAGFSPRDLLLFF